MRMKFWALGVAVWSLACSSRPVATSAENATTSIVETATNPATTEPEAAHEPSIANAELRAPEEALETRGLKRVTAGSPVPPPDWKQALVSLFVLAQTRRGDLALVKNGATLHTGDRLSFHVRVGRPAHVYLVQVFSDQRAALLYPVEAEPELVNPGVDHRIPAGAGATFELDDKTGTERVVLIASERALGSAEPALELAIRRVNQQGAPGMNAEKSRKPQARAAKPAQAEDDPHPGPSRLDGQTRGKTLDSGNSGRALDVQSDAGGIAMATMTFKHLP
jgi:hypothetical protein